MLVILTCFVCLFVVSRVSLTRTRSPCAADPRFSIIESCTAK
jgi:hypothetical protein